MSRVYARFRGVLDQASLAAPREVRATVRV